MSERMVKQFMEMVGIDSESGNEARMMEYLLRAIPEAGGEAALDAYGNLIARFAALGCTGKAPILLSCHADTVKPGVGIRPQLVDGHQQREQRQDAVSQAVVGVLGPELAPGRIRVRVHGPHRGDEPVRQGPDDGHVLRGQLLPPREDDGDVLGTEPEPGQQGVVDRRDGEHGDNAMRSGPAKACRSLASA